jgi:hypothetical protein
MHTKKLFSDSKYYGSVLKVQEFMVNDIQKTLSLKETPNFLLVLGLCCYTEYWGKLRLGVQVKEQKSEKSFNEFDKSSRCREFYN